MSSRGGWSRCPGASGVGLTAGVWRRAGLMPSSAVLGLAAWAGLFSVWRGGLVPVGLLLGLVVSHPVRERVCAYCRRRRGHQGPVKEDHVF